MTDRPVLVCMPAEANAIFADDVFGVCSRCDHAIRFRPTAPTNVVRICINCMPAFVAENGGGTVTVTQRTKDELALYYAKPKGQS